MPQRDFCKCLKEKQLRQTGFYSTPVCRHVSPLSLSVFQKLSLDLYYTEDEIYELSYTREPKNCKAPVSHQHRLTLTLILTPKMNFWFAGLFQRGILKIGEVICGKVWKKGFP